MEPKHYRVEGNNRLPSPHSCIHCDVPLLVPRTSSQPLSQRIRFHQTVSEARRAATNTCPLFVELIDLYDRRSLPTLLKAHLSPDCSCCTGLYQRLRHLCISLSEKPFQLTLQAFPRGPSFNDPVYSFAYLDCGTVNGRNRLNAYTYKGNVAATLVPTFDREVLGPETVEALRQWLSTCTCPQTRGASKDSRYRPKRLVDVDASCTTVAVTDCPVISAPNYVCLSYCWGGTQNMVLRSTNINVTGTWVVPKELIPAAFEDAFKIVRLLGYRYIWIDSLCIIQDDTQDLEREILEMPHIFKGGDLTICASSSRSCKEEFLHERPDYSEKRLRLSLPGGSEGVIHLDAFRWWAPLVPEPLSTRAWAYQERILSSRILEFGWRTSRWSCACHTSYSGYSTLTPDNTSDTVHDPLQRCRTYDLYSFLNPPGVRNFPKSAESLFTSWCAIVRAYSELDITYPDDRLAAIGGIAAELQRVTKVRYLAGLWDNDRLPSMLQWRAMSRLEELQSRPRSSRAPSWSWPSIDDKVVIHASVTGVSRFKVLRCDVSGGFSKTANGIIELQGPVRAGLWWSGGNSHYIDSPAGLTTSTSDGIELTIFPDCFGEIFTFLGKKLVLIKKNLTWIAIGRAHSNNNIVRGLLLSQTGSQKEHLYIRLGMFQVEEQERFSTQNWDIATLKVM